MSEPAKDPKDEGSKTTESAEKTPWSPGSGGSPPSPWVTPASGSSSSAGKYGDEDSGNRRIKKLGEGGYGEVWLVNYLGGLEAHKFLNKRKGSRTDAFREAVLTRSVSHPNVVRVFGVLEDESGQALRMEYVEGIDLGRYVREHGILPVDKVVPLAIQIADALQATHEREIVHLDLKPSNLILRTDGKSVVVTDFGISGALRIAEGAASAGTGGTPYFMAPELHKEGGRGTRLSDMWSLGVTLYYLVSASYPFPFDKLDADKAVLEPPIDLSRARLYVSPEFWSILRRVLSRDEERRFASMAELKAALENYGYAVTCPDCNRVFRLQAVDKACPEPSCQKQAIVRLKQSLAASRKAEASLAACEFEPAQRDFEVAAEALGDDEVFAARAAELRERAAAIPGLHKKHDELIKSAEALLDNGRYIDCVTQIGDAWRYFSLSPVVKAVRERVRDAMVELYRETPKVVKEKVKKRRFDDAREQLTRLDHLHGDPGTRRELFEALNQRGEEHKDFRYLYPEVDRQQQKYKKHSKAGRKAIESFDFKTALSAYTTLEREFPCEDYKTLLAALAGAESRYELATAYELQFLLEIVHDPLVGDRVERLRLEESREACETLLADFPPDRYPAFGRLEELRKACESAAAAVREMVGANLNAAAEFRKQKRVFQELECLTKIKKLVVGSDLFDANTRELVIERHRITTQSVKDVRELYERGKNDLAAQEYAQAEQALLQVENIAPGAYEDVPAMVDELRARIGECETLNSQLLESYGLIERGGFDFDTALDGLAKSESLYQLQSERERRGRLAEDARILQLLVESQAERLRALVKNMSDAVVLEFFNEFSLPLFSCLSEAHWTEMLAKTPELRRAICDFVGVVEPSGDLSSVVASITMLLQVMEKPPLAMILRRCSPPANCVHPASQLSQTLLHSVRRSRWELKRQRGDAATDLVHRLAELCPPDVLQHDDLGKRELARLLTMSRWAALASRAAFLGRTVSPWAAVIVASLVAGFWASSVWANKARFPKARERLDLKPETVVQAGSERSVDDVIEAFAGAGADNANVRALLSWEELQKTKAGVSAADHTVRLAAVVSQSRVFAGADLPRGITDRLRDCLETHEREIVRKVYAEVTESAKGDPPLEALARLIARLRQVEAAVEVDGPFPSENRVRRHLADVRKLPGQARRLRAAILEQCSAAKVDLAEVKRLYGELRGNIVSDPKEAAAFLSAVVRDVLVDALVQISRDAARGHIAGFLVMSKWLLGELAKSTGDLEPGSKKFGDDAIAEQVLASVRLAREARSR